ncbi:hypothetical protein [Nostoc sp.]|uniref:hypothetical protein n=1 Tax=Nostoc sp. TaxID=1180 RepID=UPI002FF66E68
MVTRASTLTGVREASEILLCGDVETPPTGIVGRGSSLQSFSFNPTVLSYI